MRVIVHGGAGSLPARRRTETDGSADGPSDKPSERAAVLDEAAETGAGAETVVDAVCAAVNVMEADPRFNAGVGSTVQSDGVVRTDAGLMTDDREAGAACAMPGVERAVDVARVVKAETPHVLVAGVHAVDLADAYDVPTGVDLWTDARREQWQALDDVPQVTATRAQLDWLRDRFGGSDGAGGPRTEGGGAGPTDGEGARPTDGGSVRPVDRGGSGPADGAGGSHDYDTVGAVASEGDRVAAATSTGGRWLALAGRVGDVPQVGAGFYCSRAGGASATGDGEDIARGTLARRAVDHLAYGRDAQAAAELAIEEFEDLTGATAGVIVMRNDGDVGDAYNSEAMQTSVADDA